MLIKLYKHTEVEVMVNTDTITRVKVLTTDDGTVTKVNIHFVGGSQPTVYIGKEAKEAYQALVKFSKRNSAPGLD